MKDLRIEIPKGHKIDTERSNLSRGIIIFKAFATTYEEIAKKLFNERETFFPRDDGHEIGSSYRLFDSEIPDTFNASSEEQLIALGNLNKLINVARYLNKGIVRPNNKHLCSYINKNLLDDTLRIDRNTHTMTSNVYFNSSELAREAMGILGADVIKSALTLNH